MPGPPRRRTCTPVTNHPNPAVATRLLTTTGQRSLPSGRSGWDPGRFGQECCPQHREWPRAEVREATCPPPRKPARIRPDPSYHWQPAPPPGMGRSRKPAGQNRPIRTRALNTALPAATRPKSRQEDLPAAARTSPEVRSDPAAITDDRAGRPEFGKSLADSVQRANRGTSTATRPKSPCREPA